MPTSNEILSIRDAILRSIRSFFHVQGYLEVQTPVRIPAPAPETHIDAVSSGEWFLQTSPELCMKRLLSKGLTRIFQICPCFRKGERGDRHLPETTLLEWYTAGEDYRWKMNQIEALIRSVSNDLKMNDILYYRDDMVNLKGPWERLAVDDAFCGITGLRAAEALRQERFDELMAFEIEPVLGRKRPVFLMDYPVETAALAKIRPGKPPVAERFELYISGIELCNAFTELTDPAEQRKRFEKEMAQRKRSGKPVYPMPEKFLRDLEGMPPATGCALGIDRLVMLFTNASTIDAVVAFTPEAL